MNHAVPGAASVRHAAGAGLRAAGPAPVAALLAVLATVPGVALGQEPHVPGDERVDRDIGRTPVDARPQIRSHLAGRMPPGWLAGDPVPGFGAYTVTIYVPGEWQGNPTSAVMNFCPPSGSPLWNDIGRIELVPIYRSARRASALCRR